MAKCDLCGREMLTAKGCGIGKMHVGGKVYGRIRAFGEDESARCHDCNALPGEFHHWGCDMERCPACGHQLISCECEDVFAEGRST